LKTLILVLAGVAMFGAPAMASDRAACRAMAPVLADAVGAMATLSGTLEGLPSRMESSVDLFDGAERQALEEYRKAATEAAEALKRFNEAGRIAAYTIQTCADN
jgi:hypothetical protein